MVSNDSTVFNGGVGSDEMISDFLISLLCGLAVYFATSYEECIKFKKTIVFGTSYFCEIKRLK